MQVMIVCNFKSSDTVRRYLQLKIAQLSLIWSKNNRVAKLDPCRTPEFLYKDYV